MFWKGVNHVWRERKSCVQKSSMTGKFCVRTLMQKCTLCIRIRSKRREKSGNILQVGRTFCQAKLMRVVRVIHQLAIKSKHCTKNYCLHLPWSLHSLKKFKILDQWTWKITYAVCGHAVVQEGLRNWTLMTKIWTFQSDITSVRLLNFFFFKAEWWQLVSQTDSMKIE